MKQLRFNDLYNPEFYMEYPDYDCRIAIRKFLDTRDTMGMARLSLSCVDTQETKEVDRIYANVVYLRNAIADLNSSFDLLLQVPWFFYRIWKEYNLNGGLREPHKLTNRYEIVRNEGNWVIKAEKCCKLEKITKYLNSTQSGLEQKINDFCNEYIQNSQKPFTVRTLCNAMKHNHALAFEELYEPYDFNVNINGEVKNLRKEKIGIRVPQNILRVSEETGESSKAGEVIYYFDTDLRVDFEYTGSDSFKFEDCSQGRIRLKIDDVYKECCKYFDALVDLFEDIYGEIYPKMCLLTTFSKDGKPNIVHSEKSISVDKYFPFA